MKVQLFMSHSKLDEKFCNKFDVAAARIGVKVFRSEFEDIESPAWKTIKKEMNASVAMFLLVGQGLVNAQQASERSPEWAKTWKYTQNWISYEVGLACQRGIDVWVYCDGVKINFPVPYLNNYALHGIHMPYKRGRDWIKGLLRKYYEGKDFPVGKWKGWEAITFKCPNEQCGSFYNLHAFLPKNSSIICPTCLKEIPFPNGWRLESKNIRWV